MYVCNILCLKREKDKNEKIIPLYEVGEVQDRTELFNPKCWPTANTGPKKIVCEMRSLTKYLYFEKVKKKVSRVYFILSKF